MSARPSVQDRRRGRQAAPGRVVPATGELGSPPPFRPDADFPVLAACLLTVLVAMWPLLAAEFTTWDDQQTVAKNPWLRAPNGERFAHFWELSYMDKLTTAGREHLFVPVTYNFWAFVASLAHQDPLTGELDAHAFHLASLLVHLAATTMVFLVIRRFVGTVPAAAAALLFGLHPVQVEPVGWVSGTKDVLCGMFCLAALWADPLAGLGSEAANKETQRTMRRSANATSRKLSYGRKQRRIERAAKLVIIRYLLATLLFALAVLSKPTAMVLPVILLAFAWARGTLSRQVITPLIPWFGLSIACALWTSRLQANPPFVHSPLWLRPVEALHALGFYIAKLLAPIQLGVDYGCSPVWLRAHPGGWALGLIPLALAALLIAYRRRARWLVAAAVIFLVGLGPVLGLVAFDFQFFSTVADHYLYLSMLGAAIACAVFVAWAQMRLNPSGRTVVGPVVFLILGILGVRSWFQARYWHDTRSLFDHALSVNPDSMAALNAKVRFALEDHQPQEAEKFALRSLAVRPDYSDAIIALGSAYAMEKRSDEALEQFHRALKADPTSADALLNIGVARAERRQFDQAEAAFRQVVALYPDTARAHLDLGNVLLQKNHYQEALGEMRQAVRLDPSDAEAHANLGWVLVGFGQRDAARDEFTAALAIDPGFRPALAGMSRLGPK